MRDADQRYTYIDPLDLPRITQSDLHAGASDGVLLEADDAPRTYLRQAPEFHDDPDGAHLFPGFADQTITYPPAFLTSHRHSRLAGYRMSLTRDGSCTHDEAIPAEMRAYYLERLANPDPFPNEETRLRATAQPGQYRFDPGPRATLRLPRSVVVLCSGEPYNFGSFLFRVLPKLHAIRRYGLSHLPMLVHANAPTHQQFLELLNVRRDTVLLHDPRHIYAIDHAIRPCLRNPQAYLDPETRALCATLRDRYATNEHGARIYISRLGHSRRGASTRAMTNEAVLIDRLRALGFLIVEPETLTARQQIEIFSSAELVVGPSGAGMFNVMFCREGTRVIDIESEPGWIHAHTCLFASSALRYAIFEGKADPADTRPVHRNWTVNIEALLDRVAAFGPERAPRNPHPVPPPAAAQRTGTLDQITPTHAHGWARDPSSPHPVDVTIFVNATPVGQARADRARDDLHAMGHCAFVFRFPDTVAPLQPGAEVAVRFARTDNDLTYSPRVLS
jgi:capsular polysaccharide biosynthesis protein